MQLSVQCYVALALNSSEVKANLIVCLLELDEGIPLGHQKINNDTV